MTEEQNLIQDFKTKVRKVLTASDSPPFLFVGSGFSIRYCEIPTWLTILKGFVENNKKCYKHNFGYYSSKCSNDPIKIASKLAEEFHDYWWTSKEYEQSRLENEVLAGSEIETAFKIELAKFVNSKKKINNSQKAEIALLKKAVISGILTTNWDNLLQELYPDFEVKIGQREAIFSDHKSIGELYKIHGCTSSPQSLVVTTFDYERFIENNHYLNAKLLTLFADYPMLFIGYSLSDPNIEMIFKNLISCLDKQLLHIEKLQNRLIFVEWQNQSCIPSLESSTYTSNSVTLPITKIKAHNFIELWEVLAELPRKLPIKTLRHLQKMVFEFVSTSKPDGKVLVHGIDELDKIEDLEVVVGFGNISKLQTKGLVGLKAKDLLEDILFSNIRSENHLEIVKEVLKTMIRKNVYVPFFKYQKSVNNLNDNNSLKDYHYENYTLKRSQKISINDYRNAKETRLVSQMKKYPSLDSLINDINPIHAIQKIPYLEKSKIEINVLRKFLIKHWEEFGNKEGTYSSPFRKCICLLDYLEFANHD